MAKQPRHRRLSEALCEAVEFGVPVLIRMGMDDWFQLLASMNAADGFVDLSFDKFEDVPIERDPAFKGCVVEHDNRYSSPSLAGDWFQPIPKTVAMMRDTRKPAIVAW